MKRRKFITLIGSAAFNLPLAVRAHLPPKIARVGYVGAGSAAGMRPIFEAFRQGLRALGYVEGQNLELEVRWADGHLERIPELVDQLVRLKVDVLVAGSSPAALPAKNATRTVPIVMLAGDPVGLGLVASLARPGGNVTGLSYYNAELHGKRLQLMTQLIPKLARVAVLKNSKIAMHAIFLQSTEAAAKKLGVKLQSIEVHGVKDFETAFATAKQGKAQALLALDDPLTVSYRSRIVDLAASNRLPALYGFREFPGAAGLISYGADFVVLFRRVATVVDKILKGAKPADLPVEQPTKFELVINLKAAKALGLSVPAVLLTQADEVIE